MPDFWTQPNETKSYSERSFTSFRMTESSPYGPRLCHSERSEESLRILHEKSFGLCGQDVAAAPAGAELNVGADFVGRGFDRVARIVEAERGLIKLFAAALAKPDEEVALFRTPPALDDESPRAVAAPRRVRHVGGQEKQLARL